MTSYFDMDTRLTRFRKHHANGAPPPKNATVSPPPPLTPNGTTKPKAQAAWRSVRAFNAPVSYRVPGIVPPERQATSMTCWATVTAMMVQWRRNQSIAVDRVIGDIGSQYLAKYRANEGLASSDKGPFLAAAGLVAEPPMSYSIEGWLSLLRTYGPLWVTTDEDPSAAFAIHARIVVGVDGDGTPDGTNFRIVDPGSGTEYSETVTAFTRKFEEEVLARGPNAPLRIQVVHWPANSQSQGQSHGRMTPAQSYRARPVSSSRSRQARAFDDAGSPAGVSDAGVDAAPAADAIAWGGKVTSEFRNRVRAIAQTLSCDPNHLMAAMAFETGETFSPSIRNKQSGATGLIQFMPNTAQSLGTTTDALAQMPAVQQLDYVERYLRPFSGKMSSVEDVYMTILWPKAVGKPSNFALFSQPSAAYRMNSGLDANQDGTITKDEAAAPVRRKLARGRQPENIG